MSINEQITDASDFDEVEYCRFYSVLESPFGHDFDCSKFYSGANRISVLEDVIIQIQKDKPMIFVRAEAGSGKTALCRMIESKLTASLCLYVNNSGRSRTLSMERQLAEGLLLDAQVFMPITHVESAIVDKLSTHERVVILLEGVAFLSDDDVEWLRLLQSKAEEFGSSIVLVFFYSNDELENLGCKVAGEIQNVISLVNLNEYEVYEYLNDHMVNCGQSQLAVFSRETSSIIAKESKGNFAEVVSLSNNTLRRAFRRGNVYPSEYDVPVTRDAGGQTENHERGAALLTARNTMLVGTISGGVMLALIWSMFGSVTWFNPQTEEIAPAYFASSVESAVSENLTNK